MFRVSDFILPKKIIEAACQSKGVGFVDLEVCFEESADSQIIRNKLHIGTQDSMEGTYSCIIKGYFNNFKNIHGVSLFCSSKEATYVFSQIAAFLNKIFRDTNRAEGWKPEEPVVQRLYQYPLVWVLMRDFVCPIEEADITNLKVIYCPSPWVDMARHFDGENNKELKLDEVEGDWLFLNSDCVHEPLEQASLFCAALEAHNICPKELMLKIKNNVYLMDKFNGIASVYFMNDEMRDDFINFVLTFSGVENLSESLVSSDNIKEAQMIEPNHSNWWFFGLIEKMLEPARGADMHIHEALESLRDTIQKRVLETKEEAGREGASYERLLRALDDDESDGKYVILEKELSSDRLW